MTTFIFARFFFPSLRGVVLLTTVTRVAPLTHRVEVLDAAERESAHQAYLHVIQTAKDAVAPTRGGDIRLHSLVIHGLCVRHPSLFFSKGLKGSSPLCGREGARVRGCFGAACVFARLVKGEGARGGTDECKGFENTSCFTHTHVASLGGGACGEKVKSCLRIKKKKTSCCKRKFLLQPPCEGVCDV